MDINILEISIQDKDGVELLTSETSIGDMIEIGLVLLMEAYKRAKAKDKAAIVQMIQGFEGEKDSLLFGAERGVTL